MRARPAIDRTMWFFAIVYAVEGTCQARAGIMAQPLTYWLKEAIHWDPVTISAALSVLDLPWIIKPLWGAISDFVPLFGYRRRPYLVLANLAGSLAFGWVAVIDTTTALIPALVLTAAAMAISSTLSGALLVETGQRTNNSANYVNQQWLWYNIAQMVAVVVAGYLIELLSPIGAMHTAAVIAAIAPLSVVPAVLLISEPHAPIDLEAFRAHFRALVRAFRSRSLWFVAGFLFLYYFSPGFGTPLYFEMTDRLHFSQGLIGSLSAVSAAGWIIGGLLYRWQLKRLNCLAMLRLSILGGVVSTLAYLLLSGPVSAVAISLLGGITSMIAMVATMSLAAESCPAGAEGFAFAAMMSILNVAGPIADLTGSLLYQHVFGHRFAPLVVVSAAATALVFFLIPLMVGRATPASA